MPRQPRTPADLARGYAERRRAAGGAAADPPLDSWRRETFRLPRSQARTVAKDWFERFPKAAYLTEVESWRVLDDGLIEFTMRRLPSAD